MNVIATDEWIDHPEILSEKLKQYFEKQTSIDHYLIAHGMYPPSREDGRELIKKLKQKDVWDIVKIEALKLKQIWNGPNVPIFIFPSDPYNEQLTNHLNGKSGLAFRDKLFLFLSPNNSQKEIKALLTHEYNHVCRLNKYKKNEKDYVLLDRMILEGLAEHAVCERWSKKYNANWTTLYSEEELRKWWKNHILPWIYLQNRHLRFRELLYGMYGYPNMIGYCVGYYLVKKYVEKYNVTSRQLLSLPSEKIAQVNGK